jgi:hypothetical protein
MIRATLILCAALANPLLTAGVSGHSQTPKAQTLQQAPRPATSAVRDAVTEFLKVWLVSKDEDRAFAFSHPDSFSNELMLSEECLDAIWEDDSRDDPESVARGVRKFLKGVIDQVEGRDLAEILNPDEIERVRGDGYPEFINSPEEDGFGLQDVSVTLDQGDEEWKHLKEKYNLTSAILSFVEINVSEGGNRTSELFFFLWVPAGKGWKIIVADKFCLS